MQTNSTPGSGTLKQIPRGIWMLGFVSMFMDISSEIIHSLLPMFLVTSLGASAMMVGLIEGVAEATTPIVKICSGALSDYLRNRKWLAVIGYGMGALSKPLFALAPAAGIVLTARVADRIGKGVRGAPRDALVADITPPHLRGDPDSYGGATVHGQARRSERHSLPGGRRPHSHAHLCSD